MVLLEVGGDVSELAENKVQEMKMSVVCNLRYDEKMLEVPGGSADRLRSVRHYDQANAVIKIDEDGIKPALRSERRLIGVQIDLPKVTLFSPKGMLTRDELELIDVLGNSLLLDGLLPEDPVAVDDSWKHSPEMMAALLGLDAVSQTDVESRLRELTDSAARMEMSGKVEGAYGGASTEIELKAKYRFDRRSQRIDWIAMLVQEKRSIGHVEWGVDAVARIQVTISPQSKAPQLADTALEQLPLSSTAELNRLTYKSAKGWQLTHDRSWYVTGDHSNLTILRMLDRGELVAQCNISTLPKLAPDKTVTLTEFQHDVQKALGKSFGEFVEAGQWAGEADYRVYRVVVRGEVSEVPIQWYYYLITDRHGRQAAPAFSVGADLVERFDEADRELVRSLRFLDPQLASNGQR